ncbi:glycoside hydrolase family 26 protein [Actinotalea solisilvae]|uniref:glycoside hydrolase family 26 protein n=1 Tax=Actinotalea solisilvae TaxID=2072922 RepID=UPI0018F1F02B|nr:glycosyl hydrolase [Actinotalea solisilvae]
MRRGAAAATTTRRTTAVRAALALGLALGLGLAAAPLAEAAVTPAVPATSTPLPAGCATRLGLGVFTPGQPNSTVALTAFETALGRRADVALTFTSFRYPLNGPALRAVAAEGRLPLITLEPWDPTVPTENRYSLQAIAAGEHDAYLRAQAATLRTLGYPVVLRFAHEMNGSWYPWGAGVQGNTPADYVAAYRHVHDLMTAEGVTTAQWLWSPATLDGPSIADVAPFYPGDAYVDWVGLSVYFDQASDTWATSAAPTVRRLADVAPGRPLYVAEAGVLPGAARPAMIGDMVAGLAATPQAIGLTWFDVASRQDWRIAAEPASLAALRDGVEAADSSPTTSLAAMRAAGETGPATLCFTRERLGAAPALLAAPAPSPAPDATAPATGGAAPATGGAAPVTDAPTADPTALETAATPTPGSRHR